MASKRISRLVKILAGAVADVEADIFQLDGRWERTAHFWALVIRQFIRHRCLLRASALSFSTLLALIPLLAVALSVTSSLLKNQDEEKFYHAVEKVVAGLTPSTTVITNSPTVNSNSVAIVTTNLAVKLADGDLALTNLSTTVSDAPADGGYVNVSGQKEIARQIHSFVQNTSSGALGVTGMIFLVFTAISLLRGIEETFNDIWGVTRGRNWLRQIVLYWTTITLGPVLITTAFGLTGSIYSDSTRAFIESVPYFRPVMLQVVPVAIICLTFALFYKLMPNTKVQFSAALIGGIFAGTAWHLYNLFGFLLTARALNASKMYGGLFLVVLLMGGLYIVWLILLFGAQIAYAYQNRSAYLQDRLADNVNQRGREFVALRLMTCLGQRFQNGLPPATVLQLSAELGIPSRLTQSVLHTLAHMRLVTEVAGVEAAFVPARPLDAINAYDVLLALRTGTGQELPLSEKPALAEIYGEFARIEKAERTIAAEISLLALVNRTPLRAALTEPKSVVTEKQIVSNVAAAAEIPEPKKDEAPAPEPAFVEVVETKLETPTAEIKVARREVVQPDEHQDFPL